MNKREIVRELEDIIISGEYLTLEEVFDRLDELIDDIR